MLGIYLALAVATIAPNATSTNDPVTVREISQLEQQMGDAFLKRDFAFIERVVAPEYKMSRTSSDGIAILVDRQQGCAMVGRGTIKVLS